MRQLRFLIALLILAASGCNCDDDGPGDMTGDTGGGGGDGGDDGSTSSVPDTGPASDCIPGGVSCAGTTKPCCSGGCSNNGICQGAVCKNAGDTCNGDLDCCTNSCINGTCDAMVCRPTGQACTEATQCCSQICGSDGTCQVLPPGPSGDSCIIVGEACTATTAGGGCCSTNCQGGVCVRAANCQANGDICLTHDDCCGNNCTATSSSPGRCEFVTGSGGGGCLQGGNPCSEGGTNCCSRICVDVGGGVPVCQFAGGCKLTGEWCVDDDHCCGGGANPNGSVICQGAPLGRCDNGQACNPVGNICGAPVLPDGGSINASQNCCDGKKTVCKLDSSGIPRCFGGCPNDVCPEECPTGYNATDPNCCIGPGMECQFRDQCCNYAPCVPNSSGILVCGESTCVGVGDVCTPGAPPGSNGCCEGTNCAESSTPGVFVCNPPIVIDPPGGSDGGTPNPGDDGGSPPDGGFCTGNGATCTTATECCSGICTGGMCGAPQQCQPQGAACTSGADCCSGLDCNVPVGMTSGTCEQGAECGVVGQSCSGSSLCCPSLACRNIGTQNPCDGTTACVCVIDL